MYWKLFFRYTKKNWLLKIYVIHRGSVRMSSNQQHYEPYIIDDFNDNNDKSTNQFICCVVHVVGERERRICTNTSKDPNSCASKLGGGSCASLKAQRIWIYHDKKVQPYTSSKTTFMDGYKEALEHYNNMLKQINK